MMNDDNKVKTPRPLSGRLIRIAGTVMAVAVPVIAISWWQWGAATGWIALLSAVTCALAVTLAHVFSEWPRGDMFVMVRLMGSSLVRVGLPLGLLVIARLAAPDWFERGMVYFVVLFYVVGLLTDIQLQVRRFHPARASASTVAGSDS